MACLLRQVPEWDLSWYHLLHRRILDVQQQSSVERYGHGLRRTATTSIFVKKTLTDDGEVVKERCL